MAWKSEILILKNRLEWSLDDSQETAILFKKFEFIQMKEYLFPWPTKISLYNVDF